MKNKVRRRLTDKQAISLGLAVKAIADPQGRNPRYTITAEQATTIDKVKVELELPKFETFSPDPEKSVPVMAAWQDNKLMEFGDYCKKHNINEHAVAGYSIVSRGGYPAYSIRLNSSSEEISSGSTDIEDLARVKAELKKSLRKRKPFIAIPMKHKREVTLVVSDLHLGAYISEGVLNPEFSFDTVTDQFKEITDKVNSMGCAKVNVVILGDLIESFTGLSHINTWKGLGKGMHGAGIIKLATELISDGLLKCIANIGEIKIVGGNHDRLTSNNKEDVDAGAADLIAWALGHIGFDVDFSSTVLTFETGNLCYVLTHGHLGMSKKPVEYMMFNYGKQDKFNVLLEGHLHSRIQKAAKVDIVSGDSVNYRKMVVPSLFTGNTYSEQLGFSTTAGYLVIEESKSGKVDVYDYSL